MESEFNEEKQFIIEQRKKYALDLALALVIDGKINHKEMIDKAEEIIKFFDKK